MRTDMKSLTIEFLLSELAIARAENAALREQLAAVEEWPRRFGDGVRASKERVSRLLAAKPAAKPAAQEGKEAADG